MSRGQAKGESQGIGLSWVGQAKGVIQEGVSQGGQAKEVCQDGEPRGKSRVYTKESKLRKWAKGTSQGSEIRGSEPRGEPRGWAKGASQGVSQGGQGDEPRG